MSTAEEKRKDNQRYIQENIDPYINRMLMELLEEKPANVVGLQSFRWLSWPSGYTRNRIRTT